MGSEGMGGVVGRGGGGGGVWEHIGVLFLNVTVTDVQKET